jgi:hypothetical protein
MRLSYDAGYYTMRFAACQAILPGFLPELLALAGAVGYNASPLDDKAIAARPC